MHCQKKGGEKVINIPIKPLSNFELEMYAKKLNIPFFRGVFDRNLLPEKPWENECGIQNYVTSFEFKKMGHWVGYIKRGKRVFYFDPIGNLAPCTELKNYLKGCQIFYNFKSKQKVGSVICGHLVLKFLSENV